MVSKADLMRSVMHFDRHQIKAGIHPILSEILRGLKKG